MSLSASIDIGSNTLRLLIGAVEDGKIIRQRCEMRITRLAEGIAGTGLLNPANIEKSVSVLKEFSRLIAEYKVTRVKAVGTSALREAGNSGEFIQTVLSETGIKTEVISGNEEAGLTARGVLFELSGIDSSLIIDIGGGSTEWILCDKLTPVDMGTVPAGVVKLSNRYIKSDPPLKSDIASLNRELAALSAGLGEAVADHITGKTALIGTAGTITTLAAIDLGIGKYDHEKIHMHIIPLSKLRNLSERLIGITAGKRKKLRGLDPERADLIIPGILFTINIMQTFGFSSLIVSDNGLLEGALIKLSEEVQD